MQDQEIKQRIDSFPRWHYRFDLKGNPTPIFDNKVAVRHQQRKKYFFDPLVKLLGNSLAGKRVLDLGCNAGFWSLSAIGGKCAYVLGIDGRQEHIDQANFVFEVKEVQKSRYDFIAGNIFDLDLNEFGKFDIVLCLGLMCHISKHMELMEQISEVNSDILMIDTTLASAKGSYLRLKHEPLDEPQNAVDHELVMIPTERAVHDLVTNFGYSVVTLKPRFDNYSGSQDYRRGDRKAFLCAKHTNISDPYFEVESPGWQPEQIGSGSQFQSQHL